MYGGVKHCQNYNRFYFNKMSKWKLYKYSFNCFSQNQGKIKRHFVIVYNFIENMHYKRIPYREDHLKLVEQFENNGNIIIGGRINNNIITLNIS